jgi:hypothetical protein
MTQTKELQRASVRNMYAACTPVAGVAPGTVLSTTPPLILWNPPTPSSFVQQTQLVVDESILAYISGTLGAGSIVYGVVAQLTAPAGGTVLTPQAAVLGNARAPVGQAFQGATLSAVPTLVKPAFVLEATPTKVQKDAVEGALSVLPGQACILQGVAGAGASPLVLLAIQWSEVTL